MLPPPPSLAFEFSLTRKIFNALAHQIRNDLDILANTYSSDWRTNQCGNWRKKRQTNQQNAHKSVAFSMFTARLYIHCMMYFIKKERKKEKTIYIYIANHTRKYYICSYSKKKKKYDTEINARIKCVNLERKKQICMTRPIVAQRKTPFI